MVDAYDEFVKAVVEADRDAEQPIVKLLESFGATDSDGRVESEAERKVRLARAREYQAKRGDA